MTSNVVPRPGGGPHLDAAAVGLDDPVDHGQAEPHALAVVLGREEGVEDPVERLLRDALAVVRHLEHRALPVLRRRVTTDTRPEPWGRVASAPFMTQVEDHLLHLGGVARQEGQRLVEPQRRLDVQQLQLVRHEADRRPHDGVEVGRGALGLRAAREGEEVGDDAPRPRGLLGDPLEVAAELGDALPRDAVVLQDPAHEGGEVQDARERVVDLVGDAGRELAERGQAVGLEQVPLRLLELGGALGDLGLELLRGPVDLAEGLAQAVRA